MNPHTPSSGLRPLLGLRLAVQSLLRDRATSLLAAVVLSLGLAAPTTFASLLWGGMRPLPVPEGHEVVRVDVVQPARDGRGLAVTGADLDAWQDIRSLAGIGGFQVRSVTIADAETAATRVSLAALTVGVFPLLGVQPQLGRIPDAQDAASAVVLGHRLWMEQYEGDPAVLGRVVVVDGTPRTVTAVMPEGFGFPFNEGAWVVLAADEAHDTPLEAVGRLSDGSTEETVAAELQARWAVRDEVREAEAAGGAVLVRSFTGGRGEGGEAVAFLGLVLVGVCLLVIACANVANLLLVRAVQRTRALGIQAALGAGRGHLGLQLLLESTLLAVAGGLGGLYLAHLTVSWVQDIARANFGYHWMRMAVDGPVLLGTAGLVLLAGFVAGALPAIRVMRTDIRAVLRSEGDAGRNGDGGRWSGAFITTQLALSCGALVAAGLAGRSLLQAGDWGSALPAEQVLVARLHLPDGANAAASGAELLDAAAAQPGVRNAALGLGAPGAFERWGWLEMEGHVYERPSDRPVVFANAVTPDFFRLYGIDLVRGRLPEAGDGPGTPAVAVVSEDFAARFLAEGDPLGQRLRLSSVDSVWATVVGVVADVDMGGGPQARNERVYFALHQLEEASPMIMVRGGGRAATLVAGLRQAVASVDPAIAVDQVQSLADLHRFMVRAPATLAALALAGGFAGLMVAAVGLYGVLAVRVRQRRRELGVRLALGADGGRLAREVLGWALRPLVPALVVGLAAAWLAGPILRVLLLGGNARDPVVFAGVALAFLCVGALAALVPALRAARLEPSRALQAD